MTGPVFQEEMPGVHPVLVQEFDGFGPLGIDRKILEEHTLPSRHLD